MKPKKTIPQQVAARLHMARTDRSRIRIVMKASEEALDRCYSHTLDSLTFLNQLRQMVNGELAKLREEDRADGRTKAH